MPRKKEPQISADVIQMALEIGARVSPQYNLTGIQAVEGAVRLLSNLLDTTLAGGLNQLGGKLAETDSSV